MVEATDEFDAGPKLAAVILEQLASAVQFPREELDRPTGTSEASGTAIRESGSNPARTLRSAQSIFVESHTIWMKGNLLQDTLYTRPEMREWGICIVDDRNGADIYIDVTRPFLTYDWIFKMINPKTGMILGTGKVTVIDGPAAAQRLADRKSTRLNSSHTVISYAVFCLKKKKKKKKSLIYIQNTYMSAETM